MATLLTALLCAARVARAGRPIASRGAPAQLSSDEPPQGSGSTSNASGNGNNGQCTAPGSCGAASSHDDDYDYYDENDDNEEHYKDGDDYEYKYGEDGGPSPSRSNNLDKDAGRDYVAEYSSVKPHRHPHDIYHHLLEFNEEAYDRSDLTTKMQRHVERLHVQRKYPRALQTTHSRLGNYTDGTKAGTPQWVGDEGAQDPENPTYAGFGRLLDVSSLFSSTWWGITDFASSVGGKMAWTASLVHRRALIREFGKGYAPCRTDLLDDYDSESGSACMLGVDLDAYVNVRDDPGMRMADLEMAAKMGILERGQFRYGHFMNLDFRDDDKFDTIVADMVLAAVDNDMDPNALDMEDMDLVLEKLMGLLKPGGTLYLVGSEPLLPVEGPGGFYREILEAFEAVTSLSGYYPKRNLSAKWVGRNLQRLGMDVFSSTIFPAKHSYEDMKKKIDTTAEWLQEIEELQLPVPPAIIHGYYEMLHQLERRAADATKDGPIFSGDSTYIIAASKRSEEEEDDNEESGGTVAGDNDGNKKQQPPPVATTVYVPKERYQKDLNPAVEELDTTPLAVGEMATYKWANGDAYDGFSARIGIPPELVETVTDYVKKMGLWDLMIDTVYNDPMEPDSTRFYNFTSPYVSDGRNFTWSAKRPDNFYGSDSDMHWFDAADEASHEDSLRALARGGYDKVMKAVGEYLGLEHLTTFSIGLLAVTKAEKGYVHVDFADSGKRAFNILFNLHTPSNDPEIRSSR